MRCVGEAMENRSVRMSVVSCLQNQEEENGACAGDSDGCVFFHRGSGMPPRAFWLAVWWRSLICGLVCWCIVDISARRKAAAGTYDLVGS